MKQITHETIMKVCELLEIDPDDTLEITIDLHTVTVTKRHAFIRRERT
jgi:DNA-binding Xre family transcriptional regulator